MRFCSIPACSKPHEARGYCHEHYSQWRAHGDPLTRLRRRRGSGWTDRSGYRFLSNRQEHVLIAERVLGRPLPPGAVVHHVDENPGNNALTNLVICPSQGYHQLLHQRQRALDASGHADYRRCVKCKRHDDVARMAVHTKSNLTYVHRECRRKKQ